MVAEREHHHSSRESELWCHPELRRADAWYESVIFSTDRDQAVTATVIRTPIALTLDPWWQEPAYLVVREQPEEQRSAAIRQSAGVLVDLAEARVPDVGCADAWTARVFDQLPGLSAAAVVWPFAGRCLAVLRNGLRVEAVVSGHDYPASLPLSLLPTVVLAWTCEQCQPAKQPATLPPDRIQVCLFGAPWLAFTADLEVSSTAPSPWAPGGSPGRPLR